MTSPCPSDVMIVAKNYNFPVQVPKDIAVIATVNYMNTSCSARSCGAVKPENFSARLVFVFG